MRAAVFRRYGPPDVLHVEDVPKPVPNDDEILVRVRVATVCAGDLRLRKADPFFLRWLSGLRRPTKIFIPGMEFSGTIEATGRKVTEFAPGQHVFGSTGLRFGANAEYACVPERPLLAVKPDNIAFETAAAIPFGGFSALHYLKLAKIAPGQKWLIYGASGSVGSYAVQLAKHFGAHVTAVCSAANLAMVESLGADDTVDYTTQDFSAAGPVYDVVFDAIGKSGFWRSVRALKRGGTYAFAASGLLAPTLGRLWSAITGRVKIVSGMARAKPGDLAFLVGLAQAGKLRAAIDRRYPLEDIAEAHRYVETGRKVGNVVIIVDRNDA